MTPSTILAAVAAAALRAGGPQDDTYGPHAFLATAQTRAVKESSGVAPSHYDPDVFWTHNDSGHGPRVYAFRLSAADRKLKVAADLGYVDLRGARSVDWEDIASGPQDRLYLFDGGNNPPCSRADKCIIRFVEPRIDPAGKPIHQAARWESARLEYPDPDNPAKPATHNEDRYDAECLLVHPNAGDVYIVTKRGNDNKTTARLYRLPAASIRWDGRTVHVLQFVADLTPKMPAASLGGLASMVTGGAIRPDGQQVAIRTYLAASLFTLPAGRPFEDVFQQKPQTISLAGETQGEGICYARNGDLITTSEVVAFGPQFSVYVTPLTTRPASAPSEPRSEPRP
jgi:hypothetical protein